MDRLKVSFLQKYGAYEYVLFMLGIMILSVWAKWLWESNFKELTWSEIGVSTFFFTLGSVCLASPLSILEWGRKKLGLRTREDKLNKED